VLALSFIAVAVLAPAPHSYAADAKGQVCSSIGGCAGGGADVSHVLRTVIDLLSVIGGAIAIIMIIIGGIKYVTSSGDANAVSSAKNTVIYAIVGLIIIAIAQTIVRFVLTHV
jgi:hypothetical protein